MTFSEEYVKDFLTGHGRPWQQYFVCSGSLTAYRDETGRIWYLVIEDDDLAVAVKRFLTQQGKIEAKSS